MSLQLLQPLPSVLNVVAEVLRSGGLLVATMPTGGALGARDKLRWLRLTAALRTRLRYPNDELLEQLPELLDEAGLDLVEDEHRRFALPICGQADAERLVTSLYLPDVDDAARERAVKVAASGTIGLSLRRIVTLRRERAG
ncbi:MAG: hypothetical protein ACRDYA_18505 [Egibacteraceae bacterium]